MKTGTAVGLAVGAVGVAVLGYLTYKTVSQPRATQPALPGSNPNLVQSGVQFIDTGKSIIDSIKQYLPQPSGEQVDYEGKLIRVARDRVYLVGNGLLHYVNRLPIADGRGWESVVEVKATGLKEGAPYSAGATSVYVNPQEPWQGSRLAGMGDSMMLQMYNY